MTNVERRDPEKIYHKMSVADAQALTRTFPGRLISSDGQPEAYGDQYRQPDFFKTSTAC